MTAGAGTITARLSFTKAQSMTLAIRYTSGRVITQTSGGSPTALTIEAIGGAYTIDVSSASNASFALAVTYPQP